VSALYLACAAQMSDSEVLEFLKAMRDHQNARLDSVMKGIDGLEARMDRLEARFDHLENDVRGLTRIVASLDGTLQQLVDRVERLEKVT
jgi:chromosome segregation ATPase